MKKIVSLLLVLLMLMGLSGCGSGPSASVAPSTTIPENWPPIGWTETLEETEEITYPERTEPPTQPEDLLPPQTDPTGPVETTPQNSEPATPEDTRPREDDDTRPEDDRPVYTQPEQDDPQQSDPQPTQSQVTEPTTPPATQPSSNLDPNGSYDSKWQVAEFIVTYGRLPNNYITKSQAEDQYNWQGGSLKKYGKCIGGDRFYNKEGKLPKGYTYYECDIGTLSSSGRGEKRLVYTKTGIVYYTDDHYETFTRLY